MIVISTQAAILVAALFATMGWLYAARRARTLAKKQHTFNLLIRSNFDQTLRDALSALSPHLRARLLPDVTSEDRSELRDALRLVLNHYEFVASGIRNGDLDEALVRHSERGTILTLIECSSDYIHAMRNTRRRRSIYEHLEWIHDRWERCPPGRTKRSLEMVLGRPFKGRFAEVREYPQLPTAP